MKEKNILEYRKEVSPSTRDLEAMIRSYNNNKNEIVEVYLGVKPNHTDLMVIWKDGTKTTVKKLVTKYQTPESVPFDAETALAVAIMNKVFGNHSKFVNGYVVKSEHRKNIIVKKKTVEKKDNPQEVTAYQPTYSDGTV